MFTSFFFPLSTTFGASNFSKYKGLFYPFSGGARHLHFLWHSLFLFCEAPWFHIANEQSLGLQKSMNIQGNIVYLHICPLNISTKGTFCHQAKDEYDLLLPSLGAWCLLPCVPVEHRSPHLDNCVSANQYLCSYRHSCY